MQETTVPLFDSFENEERCRNLYNYITINPYSQLLACCGLTGEYNPYLKLGDLHQKSLEELYNSQFEDLFLVWLYTLGPKYIYNILARRKNIIPKVFSHPCVYCAEIVKDNGNIDILKELIKKDLPQILFQLELINMNLKH